MGTEIPVVVTGAAGRMGRRLVAAVMEDPDTALAGATEAPGHPSLGMDAGELAGQGRAGVSLVQELPPLLERARVVIDFTSPQATEVHARECARAGTAIVIGTTGMSGDQLNTIKELSSAFPCVMAPNMSTGVNLMFHLVREAAAALGDGFDIEIVETHHRMKKDAPSGTALGLGRYAAEGRGWSFQQTARFCREGNIGERPDKEIGIQSLRAGDIIGEHTVIFAGQGERIELVHKAHTRDTFARGAVRAAKWAADKPPGSYHMMDVLGLGA